MAPSPSLSVSAYASTDVDFLTSSQESVTTILARFADAGFTPAEVVALLASYAIFINRLLIAHSHVSHSIAGADDVDPTISGTPFDSTPSVFDTQFFVETQLVGTLFPGTAGNQGEVESPVAGVMRLESDFALARDSRTACLWQANVNNQAHMASTFQKAFAKMQVIGQDVSKMVDCSELIPVPPTLSASAANAFFPPGLFNANVQQACANTPFPLLRTVAGRPETVPEMYVIPLACSFRN
jgi:hypothetical protein